MTSLCSGAVMAVSPQPEHARLIQRLGTIAVLTDPEKQAIADLPLRIRDFKENTDLVTEGDYPSECCMVVAGFVFRYKLLGRGRRQIFSFHLPGDIPDLQSLHLAVMDHNLGALTPGRAAYIPHAALRDLTERHPNLASILWRDTLIDSAVFREWLASVGRRSARQRVAHLICEVTVRMRALDLITDHAFNMPVTQAELGDALGLSTVHINRVLQAMRREDLLTWRGTALLVLDWERLKAVGDFDAAYLHLLADPFA